MNHTLHARDRRARLAEIHLRGPRRPREPRIPLRLRAMPLPPPLDPTLHRRIRTLEPVLVAQPLPHTHGGMPLLAREPEIGGQPSLDDLGVPRIDRRPASPAGRTRGEILPRGVLHHRRPGHMQLTRDPRMAHALSLQLPDTLLHKHRCRQSLPPGNLENGYRHPGIYQETGRHRCPIPQPTTPSKMNATTVQK